MRRERFSRGASFLAENASALRHAQDVFWGLSFDVFLLLFKWSTTKVKRRPTATTTLTCFTRTSADGCVSTTPLCVTSPTPKCFVRNISPCRTCCTTSTYTRPKHPRRLEIRRIVNSVEFAVSTVTQLQIRFAEPWLGPTRCSLTRQVLFDKSAEHGTRADHSPTAHIIRICFIDRAVLNPSNEV